MWILAELQSICELVYGDKQVGEAPGRLFEWPNQVKPPDHEGPHVGDHLERLGQEVSLPSIVLTPFVGAHNLLGIGYCGGLVETLSECIPNQGSWCGMMTACVTPQVFSSHICTAFHKHEHHASIRELIAHET